VGIVRVGNWALNGVVRLFDQGTFVVSGARYAVGPHRLAVRTASIDNRGLADIPEIDAIVFDGFDDKATRLASRASVS
jgi:hypothetical protein